MSPVRMINGEQLADQLNARRSNIVSCAVPRLAGGGVLLLPDRQHSAQHLQVLWIRFFADG